MQWCKRRETKIIDPDSSDEEDENNDYGDDSCEDTGEDFDNDGINSEEEEDDDWGEPTSPRSLQLNQVSKDTLIASNENQKMMDMGNTKKSDVDQPSPLTHEPQNPRDQNELSPIHELPNQEPPPSYHDTPTSTPSPSHPRVLFLTPWSMYPKPQTHPFPHLSLPLPPLLSNPLPQTISPPPPLTTLTQLT